MAKRRISLILTVLLIGAVLFGGEELVRAVLQEGLSRTLQVPVRIRRLSFSPSRLTLHGVSFAASSKAAASAPLVIHRLRIEGSPFSSLSRRFFKRPVKDGTQETLTVTGLTLALSGVPLQAGGRVTLTAEQGKPAWCEGWLTLDHPLVRGDIEISGPALGPVLLGAVEGPGFKSRRFVAQLAMGGDSFALERMEVQGGWTARGSISMPKEGAWKGEAEARGPDGEYKLELSPLPGKRMQAVLWMRRSGGKAKTVSASWGVRRSFLQLKADLLRQEATLGGVVDLRPPHGMDLELDFKDLDVAELMDWYLPGVVESRVSGFVRGRVRLTGPPSGPVSVGELFGTEGSFGPLKFDSIALRFRGQGPVLRLRDSQIIKPRGVVTLEGMVDLRRIGQKDFFKSVRIHSDEPGFLDLLGLELSSAREGSGVRVGRTAGKDGPRVGLTYRMDDAVPQEPLERQELDMEYPLSAQEHVNLRVRGEEEVLSIEHRRKF